MRNLKSLLLLVFLAFGLISCGPEKNTLDLEREQREEKLKQKIAENEKLVGVWIGELSAGESMVLPAKVEIWRQEVPAPGSSETTIVSTLAAYFTVLTEQSTENQDPLFELNVPEVAYSGGDKVVMAAQAVRNGDKAVLNLTYNGNRLQGVMRPPRPVRLPDGTRTSVLTVWLVKQ